jgi:hypothetical protein
MFNGLPPKRTGHIAPCLFGDFIEVDFYQQSADLQKQSWNNFVNSNIQVAPCHRQYGYDFRLLDPAINVITVVQRNLDAWVNRFLHLHVELRSKTLFDPIRQQMLVDRPDLADKILSKDYQTWLTINLLDNDIIFEMDQLSNNQYVQDFCKQHGLGYDVTWITDILANQQQWIL